MYRCFGKNNRSAAIRRCALPFVKAEFVEAIAWTWLLEVMTPQRIEQGIRAEHERTATQRATINRDIHLLEQRRSDLDRQRDEDVAAYQLDAMSIDELKKSKAVYENATKQIDAELAKLDELRRAGMPEIDPEVFAAEVTELRRVMPLMNNEERAALLDRLGFAAERRVQEDGSQYLHVQCLIANNNLFIRRNSAVPYQPELSNSPRTG